MIQASLHIPPDVLRALEGLPDRLMRKTLRGAAGRFSGSGGVLEKHWEDGQSAWADPDPAYEKRKGGKPKFVKSGDALDGMTNPRSRFRKVRVSKSKKDGGWRITIALYRKGGNGQNVYSIVQKGKFKGTQVVTKYGRRLTLSAEQTHARDAKRKARYANARDNGYRGGFGKWRKGNAGDQSSRRRSGNPMLVSVTLPGDEDIVFPVLLDEIIEALTEHGLLS